MVTALHEGLVGIATLEPERTAHLLRALFGLPLTPTDAQVISNELSEISPSVYRADAALLYTEGDGRRLGVITEVQLQPDDTKHRTWLAYIANLRARDACQACLVVICPDRATAEWASRRIETGHPGLTLSPLVIGPDNTPAVTEVAEAVGNIGLAAISAITHSQDPRINAILAALVEALDHIDPEQARRYAEYVTVALRGDAQKEMERLMATETFLYQGKYAQSLIARGKAEGKAEGEAKGEAKGKAKGEAQAVLLVLETRGLRPSEDERQRVMSCTDIGTLERWLRRAVLVDSVGKLFE
ncbi:hypothetical protein OUY22_04710 [Nonomuraea sp. MCN248]|uniref:Rpn family recombination-promoting nuclease/putative transposase n=1 Tax=Nonomuraea corallina TaxID=2989783 RepID=A0ABT4S679_9ACTN|nr:hypothetical protein [Nonomuraea corallina]MDA0632708.1 hypothetical protein [Nonomuraea corallina]